MTKTVLGDAKQMMVFASILMHRLGVEEFDVTREEYEQMTRSFYGVAILIPPNNDEPIKLRLLPRPPKEKEN